MKFLEARHRRRRPYLVGGEKTRAHALGGGPRAIGRRAPHGYDRVGSCRVNGSERTTPISVEYARQSDSARDALHATDSKKSTGNCCRSFANHRRKYCTTIVVLLLLYACRAVPRKRYFAGDDFFSFSRQLCTVFFDRKFVNRKKKK